MLPLTPQARSQHRENEMIELSEITGARDRIQPHLVQTPLRKAMIRQYAGRQVHYKCEQLQVTGSFKVRGALNRTLSLPSDSQRIIAASTGNHGVACAYAAKATDKRATIYMPGGTSEARMARIRSLGADVKVVGSDCIDAEAAARQEMKAGRGVYISPYNDFDVIAGQGTLGLELVAQCPKMTHIYVAVGGGGLISGIASAVKHFLPHVTIVGCSPTNSNVMRASVDAEQILTWSGKATLSKSTAGGLEPGAVTFPLCSEVVDEWVDVDEEAITEAMEGLLNEELLYVEGAAAVADAALRKHAPLLPANTQAVVVLCGANR